MNEERPWFPARLVLLLCATGLLLSCGGTEPVAPVTATTASATVLPTGGANPRGTRRRGVHRLAAAPGRGVLKVVYGRLTTEHRKEIQKAFQEERLFEDVVDSLNATLVLPRNVEIRLLECKEANAFYDPESKAILICYEGFEHLMEIFAPEQQTEAANDEAAQKAVAALVFTFYHELGHALIDVYDLPVTGREEDAVDQLATVMLLETWDEEDSQLSILSSAEAFELDAGENSDEADLSDEHSLDQQRYYNLVCWIYGSDPDYFSDVAKDWELPANRAAQCSGEYARMSASWNTLLGPHMRPEEAGPGA
ncbi:MAG: DUF4344 domain-containing metallopeptidase [Acidobacteriota bacterium]